MWLIAAQWAPPFAARSQEETNPVRDLPLQPQKTVLRDAWTPRRLWDDPDLMAVLERSVHWAGKSIVWIPRLVKCCDNFPATKVKLTISPTTNSRYISVTRRCSASSIHYQMISLKFHHLTGLKYLYKMLIRDVLISVLLLQYVWTIIWADHLQ